jgi:glycosyltransferase involved in cell wall biosynthesis
MHKIASSLTDAGYDVTLVGRVLSSSLTLDEKIFSQTRLKCLFNKGKFFYIEFNIRLFFFLLKKKTDIIGCVDLDTALPALLVSRIKNKKFTYDAHEYFPEVPEVENRPVIKKIWQWVENLIVPRANAVYTVSGSIAKVFEEKYGVKAVVIRNVPVLEPYPESNIEHKYILYQGALNEGRGLEQLIGAMKKINANLIIAGEGDLSDKVRSLAANSEVKNKITFLGLVKPENLRHITAGAFIGYNLLENRGKSYYYSLSNKFFDYIHAGIPVISNAFPEYEKINSESEVALLIDTEEESIVQSVNAILSDEIKYFHLKKNCEGLRKKYNWQLEQEKLVKLYHAL